MSEVEQCICGKEIDAEHFFHSEKLKRNFCSDECRTAALKSQRMVEIGCAIPTVLIVLFVVTTLGRCNPMFEGTGRSRSSSSQSNSKPQKSEWYAGGTLHKAGPEQWKLGDYKNRLATSSDFVAAMWQQKKLNFSINSMDELKPKAVQLEACISKAMFEGQKASDLAALCMIQMKWLK